MAEELDATRAAQLPPAIILLVVMLLIGVALEVAGRWLHAWARRHGRRGLGAFLDNVRWQPLVWSIILGLHLTLPRTWIARVSGLLGINPLLWLALVTVAYFVVRALSGMATRAAEDHGMASTSLLAGMIHGIGYVAIALLGMGLLGVPVDGLVVALAGSSVGIGLALQQPLTNLFAGLLLSAADRFRPGELIRLNTGQEGRVVDLDWLTTTIEDASESLVAVPNVSMMTAIVVNYDRPSPSIVFDVPVAVSRVSDLALVERLTTEAAQEVAQAVDGVDPAAPPKLSYAAGFDDDVVHLNVSFRVASHGRQGAVRSALIQRLEGQFLAAGITMFHPVGLATPLATGGDTAAPTVATPTTATPTPPPPDRQVAHHEAARP